MKSILNQFEWELAQLSEYSIYLDSIGAILKHKSVATDQAELIDKIATAQSKNSSLLLRKVFEYNSIVTSLYGFF